jgi:uncharacterized protein RhaS with RHS repeats
MYTPSIGAATNYVPDALNRIASMNGAAFRYDGRGNLEQDNTETTYTYNANNLLLNATKAGVTTTLSYDAENSLTCGALFLLLIGRYPNRPIG